MTDTTWDGTPIAYENPRGVTIIIHRISEGKREVLLLHRAHHGADYKGDWAWTPPSGARQPHERVEDAAKRELKEETGIVGVPFSTTCGNDFWHVYELEVSKEQCIELDDEHDRYEWVRMEEAVTRCSPESVSSQLRRFADLKSKG